MGPEPEHTLDQSDNVQRCGLRVESPNLNANDADLGILGRLPAELLDVTLSMLDLADLMQFSEVNRRAAATVLHLYMYKALVNCAPIVIKAIFSIQVGHMISLAELHRQFCMPTCRYCGDFAPYIYLLRCERVCYPCFTDDPRLYPLGARRLRRQFGLSAAEAREIPSFLSVPGVYTNCKIKANKRIRLYDPQVAGALKTNDSGAVGTARPLVDENEREAKRFMAVVQVPVFDKTTQTLQYGGFCAACLAWPHFDLRRPPAYRRYDLKSFPAHFSEEFGHVCRVRLNGRNILIHEYQRTLLLRYGLIKEEDW